MDIETLSPDDAAFIGKCEAYLKSMQERRGWDEKLLSESNVEYGDVGWKKYGNEVAVTVIDDVAMVFEIDLDGNGGYYPYPWPEGEVP